jgi:hypothetical protein
MSKEKLLDIIDSLQPTPDEYSVHERFYYLLDYACELDVLSILVYSDQALAHVKDRLEKGVDGTAEYDAVADFVLTANERGFKIV